MLTHTHYTNSYISLGGPGGGGGPPCSLVFGAGGGGGEVAVTMTTETKAWTGWHHYHLNTPCMLVFYWCLFLLHNWSCTLVFLLVSFSFPQLMPPAAPTCTSAEVDHALTGPKFVTERLTALTLGTMRMFAVSLRVFFTDTFKDHTSYRQLRVIKYLLSIITQHRLKGYKELICTSIRGI